MRQRNDGQGEVNGLQNRFTAYLLRAIQREKKDYINKQRRLDAHEFSAAPQDISVLNQNTFDPLEQLPIPMRLENMRLLRAIESLDESERSIFLARVLEERSYDELAQKLGLRYKGASAAYYRVLKKLRCKLGGDKQ